MAKGQAAQPTSEESITRGYRSLKKINNRIRELKTNVPNRKVRLMFQDEAGFGRINKPRYCWCIKGIRPSVPCLHIREYRYAYGAVDPLEGDSFFLVLPYCDTICMNVYLKHLSMEYPEDHIVLVTDGAVWHKANALEIPENIEIIRLPPYTPEMNPIEQIWAWIRLHGFRNEVFQTLDDVVGRLCHTICALSFETVKSITHRDWMLSAC